MTELTLTEQRRMQIEYRLNQVLQAARDEGFTVGLNTVQLSNPPRMGNYGQRITVHLARELYRSNK